jgi:hypothetical protein
MIVLISYGQYQRNRDYLNGQLQTPFSDEKNNSSLFAVWKFSCSEGSTENCTDRIPNTIPVRKERQEFTSPKGLD